MILALRTDSEAAELNLLDVSGHPKDCLTWIAGRTLSASLLQQILDFLGKNHLGLESLSGLVVFEGPGSFTGLRIGITVINALAYSLRIPAVGAAGDDWQSKGVLALSKCSTGHIVIPKYGTEANVTPACSVCRSKT